MASVERKLVHKQFNSPIGLYSQDNVKETLNRELAAFGRQGIEIDNKISRPLNLANSEVLRAVEEEEQMKCEPIKCERQSRSRQRIYQQSHTPVHQQQLEQIKTQYLSHYQDITIDRDTVLKINRLTTRRSIHKREQSWPPVTKESSATNTIATHEHFNNIEKKGKNLKPEQHVRSTSIDNALQFDETVCKRHGIDGIREKFNSPTRIIEPTPQELRRKREQKRKLQQLQKQKHEPQQQKPYTTDEGGCDAESCATGHGVTTNKPKQMINLVKHEELLRKKSSNKSSTMAGTAIAQRANEKSDFKKHNIKVPEPQSVTMSDEIKCDSKSPVQRLSEDELYKTTTVPKARGFSHPETKAADENIGLVEPKRQMFEKFNSSNKWLSYDNLNALSSDKAVKRALAEAGHNRQACSLERGREARQHQQLPPQKPRSSPKLQRRCMKLSTEMQICYNNDVQQPAKPSLSSISTTIPDDLEHIPLPATPSHCNKIPSNVQQSDKQQSQLNSNCIEQYFKDQEVYDDSCIFLRSVDLQDNTIAYIPAALTIVPSPTKELMQNWMESSKLKANIKAVNYIESSNASDDLQNKNENSVAQLKNDTFKSVSSPEGIKHQQSEKQQQPQNDKQDAKAARHVTRLTNTPNGIELTRQATVSTKRKTQMNNNNNADSKNSSNQQLIAKVPMNDYAYQARTPGAIHSNETPAECKKIVKNDYQTQQAGTYYTDGGYVYGPFDHHNATPKAGATIHPMPAEEQERCKQLQHPTEIKKDIEAETKSQHKNEIANLTAKYENIQKSINEHLRQIDTYIENAKAALKSTIAFENKPESLTQLRSNHPQCNFSAQLEQKELESAEIETPLKEILRKITYMIQDVKPLHRNEKTKPETCMPPIRKATEDDREENMPVVDKVLMDLNMLTKHLSEFNKTSTEEPKPIIEQLDLKFEIRPTSSASEEGNLMETGPNAEECEKAIPAPPTPPPLPLQLHSPPTVTPAPVPTTKPMQKKQHEKIQHDADKQLLATDKLITAQTQSQQDIQQLPHQPTVKESTRLTVSTAEGNDKDAAALIAAAEDKNKNYIFDFIRGRHEQQQLVEQVIDTLGKLENETKNKLVNTHVPAHDEYIKSNLNQHTTSSQMTILTNSMERDRVASVMQNCNISASQNTCNHDNVSKPTKGNESQLKLHIKNFAEKKADKQFQKYDNPSTGNINDVVNNERKYNNAVAGQTQLLNKPVTSQHHFDDDDKTIKIKEEEGGSNHSSGSELSNTNKSSYELPSPYITMRQISWEDILPSAAAQTFPHETDAQNSATTTVLTKSANIIKPKHEIKVAQVCNKLPASTTLALTAPKPVMTSAHITTQSPEATKPHIQNTIEQPQQNKTTDEYRKYPLSITDSQLLKRVTSPVEIPFKQRSASASPTLLLGAKTSEATMMLPAKRLEFLSAMQKYPAPLTQPLGQNAIELTNFKRSLSTSPKRTKTTQRISPRTVEEFSIRKYPAPLAEPHIPTRSASPFGLNPVDVSHITRATTTLPAYQVEVAIDNEQEQKYYDEHTDDKPTSPIRKYPASLIEPHVPTRAASPFGLNAVYGIQATSHQRTPSPIRSPLSHHHQQAIHDAKFFKLPSTNSDSCKKALVYVPQVEGHNIGLLVRTTTPTPYRHTDAIHASSIHCTEMINAANKTHDFTKNITDNKYCNVNDIGRAGKNDDATYDELQRINTIDLTAQGGTAKNITMPHQPQKQQQQQNCDRQHPRNPDIYVTRGGGATGSGSGSGSDGPDGDADTQHSAISAIPLPTSAINRSFDNVSPRPYNSTEGYKRVAWPPASEERIVHEFTPQPQTQYQPEPVYNQQHQPSAVATGSAMPPTQPQPHQQPHTVSHDQVDQQNQCQPHLSQNQRGASPGIITLRKEAPITQKPAPIYTAQPAATSFRGGSSMRGDLKWPPPEYKEAAAKENEERRKLALGPVCRPRKVNRDYTSFFAKNALSHHYPSYKVPPGTQHMIN